jgi:hypothetical protein
VKTRRKLANTFWSNCWLVCLSLLLSKRLGAVVVVFRWPKMPHAIGVTRKGRCVHFRGAQPPRGLLPLWGVGYVEVFPAKHFVKLGGYVWLGRKSWS